MLAPFTHPPTPMLAKEYKEGKHDKLADYVGDEVYLQPKYDGIRALFDGTFFWSRKKNPLPVPDHVRYLAKQYLDPGVVLDGEIYIHGKSFQEIQSILKNQSKPSEHRAKLLYRIYDCYFPHNPNATFRDRWSYLEDKKMPNRAPTTMSKFLPGEIRKARKTFEDMGYEGVMIRNPDGLYIPTRSKDLLKFKSFEEADFVIVDVKEGKGKNKGTAVFTCRVAQDDNEAEINEATFDVTAPGDYEDKAIAWRDRDHLIGKKLTVKYQELTDDGIPRFPVALGIKEDR